MKIINIGLVLLLLLAGSASAAKNRPDGYKTICKIDQVMRDTDANPRGRGRLAILSGASCSYTDESVANGTQYWYWIKYTYAHRVVGNSNAKQGTCCASMMCAMWKECWTC